MAWEPSIYCEHPNDNFCFQISAEFTISYGLRQDSVNIWLSSNTYLTTPNNNIYQGAVTSGGILEDLKVNSNDKLQDFQGFHENPKAIFGCCIFTKLN